LRERGKLRGRPAIRYVFDATINTVQWAGTAATSRDPYGIHKAIWDEFVDEPFQVPPGKPFIVAS
jgi:hypothetical protein